MDHDHGTMSPPSDAATSNGTTMVHKMTTHMTFFWGKNAEILFSGWPGTRTGMYVLALIVVFVLAVLVEWLSHSELLRSTNNNVIAGLLQTVMHALRMGLAYLVMLAVMSFNVGVFIAVVAGHALGFLLFGSRVFRDTHVPPYEKRDLPPMSC